MSGENTQQQQSGSSQVFSSQIKIPMRTKILSQNVAHLIIVQAYLKSQQCCNFAFSRVVIMFWWKNALLCVVVNSFWAEIGLPTVK